MIAAQTLGANPRITSPKPGLRCALLHQKPLTCTGFSLRLSQKLGTREMNEASLAVRTPEPPLGLPTSNRQFRNPEQAQTDIAVSMRRELKLLLIEMNLCASKWSRAE
jgi:hypothetical protein